MTTLGALLEKARTEQGLSQEDAAAALGATPVTYRGWLRGQKPGYSRLDKLAKFTGVSEGEILNAIRTIPGYLNPRRGSKVAVAA